MYIKVGAIFQDGCDELNTIFAVAPTDDAPYEVFLHDGFGAAYNLSNILIARPLEVEEETALNLIRKLGADGIIMSLDSIILLKGNKAEWHSPVHMDVITEVTDFDTDMSYDEFDDDEIY